MSFDVFENIFTASDPAGGRAIKVSTLTGIDSAESIYTQNDPAGGRAIKVKIIAGGASNGTLQIAGGLPITSLLQNITDSVSPTANRSPLFLSSTAMEIKATSASDGYLLTLDGRSFTDAGGDIYKHAFLRINAAQYYTSMVDFSYTPDNQTSRIRVGTLRSSEQWGIGLTVDGSNQIRFYTSGTSILAGYFASDGIFQTSNNINVGGSLSILGTNGNGVYLANQSANPTSLGGNTILFSDSIGNLSWMNQNTFYTTLKTLNNTQNSSLILPDVANGTIALTDLQQTFVSLQSFSAGLSSTKVELDWSSSTPAGVDGRTTLWTDSTGRLNWRIGTGATSYIRTFDATGVTGNRTYVLPNASVTLAGLELAQTFTAAQTFSSSLSHGSSLIGNWIAVPSGTASKTTLFYNTSGNLAVKIGTGSAAIFDTSAISGGDKTFTLPNLTTTIAGLGVAQTFTAAQTISVNGALSTPGFSATGTWITGGSATTTKPYFLIETTGATSTNWSTSGTGLAVNAASGFVGNLLDLQTNGAAEFKVAYNGNITGTGNLTITGNGASSAPAITGSGTWATGTSPKPFFLIEPSGATSNTWNNSGTGIAVNAASGFTGNLFAAYINGAPSIRINKDGDILIGSSGVRLQSVDPTSIGSSPSNTGAGLASSTGNTTGHGFIVYAPSLTATTGSGGALKIESTFTPSGAGSMAYTPLNIRYTINSATAQTGVVTGIYARATETNLNGATHNLIDLGVGASSVFSVSNVGVPNFNQATSASAGGSAGTHLNIKVGVTSYKIALLLP